MGLEGGQKTPPRRWYQIEDLGEGGCLPPASEGPDTSRQRDRPWEGPEAGASLGPGKGKRPAWLQQGEGGPAGDKVTEAPGEADQEGSGPPTFASHILKEL